jgi:hypothetical protein
MLPVLPSPSPLPLRLRQVLAPLLLAVVLLLPLGLSGCSAAGQPPRSTVMAALGLQIELTQGSIARALGLESGGLPEVSRVRIEEQQALPIADGKGLRLAGRFDWRLAGDPIRVDSPFEIYLQRGERGQSWRLARPLSAAQGDGPQEWLIDPLPIRG